MSNKIQISDSELIDALEQSEKSRVFAAKRLARWFSLDVTIKLFGQVIFEWHYPPEDER